MELANSNGNCPIIDTESLVLWMASSEVDQKALGNFAALTSLQYPILSATLYRILDPTRETKSLQLYHHIIWLSREGLLVLEEFVLPFIEGLMELKILAYKLRASFYHIFVLFHNQPAIHSPGIVDLQKNPGVRNGTSDPESPTKETNPRFSFKSKIDIISISETSALKMKDAAHDKVTRAPPGLAPVQPPRSASSFLLPALDYIPTATACFNHAALLAERFLPGSHPLRLSIKLEYAAYLYDCLHDSNACRRLAKQAIADVYNAQEGMDDESFEDAAEIVGILGKMVKRGGKTSSAGSSTTPSGTLRGESSRSGDSRTPPGKKSERQKSSSELPPAVPDPNMMNPI
ncbi:hypothetical protein EYZ11_012957 [Aspergillus tanneri]|uniref:14-3-3 domain-containing protein n=1 Tax=Aspergillus tanneri TaxID=1220188 RepID=A0A4S3IZ60_9EURO|nr:hypothetical protein EYZ11_012957 [Aspergillus tanneri]